MDSLISIVIEPLSSLMNHQSPSIRKTLVFCFVDLSFMLTKHQFERYLQRLNENQKKLIHIYVEKRQSN
jgi:CLIP-associating protein 1/2